MYLPVPLTVGKVRVDLMCTNKGAARFALTHLNERRVQVRATIKHRDNERYKFDHQYNAFNSSGHAPNAM